nr:hypothetical protein [Tanacetum cinerariifolium]
MATTIEQQVALDEAFVPSTKRFKMDTRKNIVDLEAFREMLHISPRVPSQSFDELPFKEKIVDFLRFLGHSAQIKTLTDVNVNKLFQPWRSFAAVINKRNVDYAFLIWEDFVYQVEHKNQKKKRDALPKIHKSHHSSLHDEETFKPKRKQTPKPKASARKKRGGSDSPTTPPTVVASPRPIITVAAAPRLTAAGKGKQPARATSLTNPSEVERTESKQLKIVLRRIRQETYISQHGGSSTDEGTRPGHDDEGEKNDESDADDDDQDDAEKDDDDEEEIAKLDEQKDTESDEGDAEETKSDKESIEEEIGEEEEESFDPILRTPEDSEDDGNGEEDQRLRVSEEQRLIEEEEADELYRDVNINQGWGLQVSQESSSVSSFVTSMLNPISDAGVESIFTTASSLIAPIKTSTPIMTPSTIATITTSSEEPIPPTTIPSAVLQNLPTFDSVFRFEDRVKSLEVNFLEFMQTNQFAEAVSKILAIVHQYMTQQMTEAIREAMEGNKSIQRSDEQRKLYKALVDAYEADKTILESYGDTTILKRRRRDDDDQEGPSAGSERGSKRRREGGKPESASTPSEPATRSSSRSTTGTQSRQMSASESAFVEESMQTTCQMDEPPHPVIETGAEDQSIVQTFQHPELFSQPRKPPTPDRDWNKTLPAIQGSAQTWISKLVKQDDSRSSFNELLDTPIDFSNFIMNRLGVDTLTPELLAGPTYELMRRSCTSLTELEYHLEEVYKVTTDQLDWVNPEGQQYPHNLLQPLPLIPDNRGRRVIPFAHFINNDLEYLRGGRVPTEMELILDHTQQGISYEVPETLKTRWRYLVPVESHIHNCMLIPNYQDIIYQDFRYSDALSNLGRYEHVSLMSLEHKGDEIT